MDTSLALLKDLIAIDSVNPSLVPGGAGEGEIARFVAAEMRRYGMDVELPEAAPGRPNVVGVIESGRPGPALMLCGHLDTVGVAGMNAPFDPVERNGRIYGRGSQDMKGGVAAMMAAAGTCAADGLIKSGRLIVAAVVDEEYRSLGADALVERWHADAAIVTEPTDLKIAIGHKGFVWIEITTEGRAAHGSRPEEGRDAIAMMGRILVALEALDRDLRSRPPHPIIGTGSLHASLIEGGRELSSYPDRCVLSIERRTIAGESDEVTLREIESILESFRRNDTDFKATARIAFSRPAYLTPLPLQALSLLQRALPQPTSPEGMTYWTDAAILGHSGTPSFVFGPGGEGLHGLEEYVRADEVLVCRDVLVDVARRFCE